MTRLLHYSTRLGITCLVIGSLLCAANSLAGADIHDVRIWRSPDKTRVVLDLNDAVEHKVFTLENPNRVVIDIPDSEISAGLDQLDWQDSPVVKLRTGKHGDDTLRIVLDLTQPVKPRSFLLRKNRQYNDRLVIDLHDAKQQKSRTKSVDTARNNKRDLIIAIDAGHGGEDPGAIGPGNTYEKHVVMAIAQKLAQKLDNEPGYKPVLIRTGDYYVSLAGRRERARKAQADLFISIHADAFTSPQAHGSSVYALSSRGATSTFAKFLAERESNSDLVGGVSLSDKDEVLSSVLVDLSMTHKQEASIDVGSSLLKEMGQISRLHSKRVELAAFAVLKTPDVPAILVETGFISNPGEAKKLRSSWYQDKMASALFNGVNEFFYRRPPEGTYIAWKKHNGGGHATHVVSRGDTLSGIASRYAISMNELRNHNRLSSSQIRIGQTLSIPGNR